MMDHRLIKFHDKNMNHAIKSNANPLRACRVHVREPDFNGSVQDCSITSALAMEILQSCTKVVSITMPTNYQALNSAWPSADTMMTGNLNIISFNVSLAINDYP